MTREELKEHCKRQVQQFERVEKIMPVTPNDWKRYEEHKLILELLEQESILDFIKDCKNKIENYGKDYMFTQEEVLNIIERYAIKYTKSFKWQESEEVNGR